MAIGTVWRDTISEVSAGTKAQGTVNALHSRTVVASLGLGAQGKV